MFKIARLFSASLAVLLIASCQDISNFRDSYDKTPLAKVMFSKDDSLSFLFADTIDLGTIMKPRFKYQQFSLTNLSDELTISVYSLKGPNGFVITSANGYPVLLPPHQSNSSSTLTLSLNSGLYNTGEILEKICINESNLHYIFVKAIITN